MSAPCTQLNNGYLMPTIGLGVRDIDPEDVYGVVKDAVDAGFRHFDCATLYDNEKEVGQALREKIEEGVVTRQELFVTSKLWNTHHRPELVVQACRKSVYDMGLDYLDLYLIHWPIAFQEGEDKFPRDEDGRLLHEDLDYLLTYREMEQCVRYGLARSIGVANFNSEQIFRVLGVAVIKPVVNQIECHPYLNQTNLIRFCNKRGILVTASSPLGAPNLVPGISGTPNLLSDARLEPLAKKYNKSPAQIILRYHVQRGTVPLPKVTDRDHMIEDLQIFDFDLSEGDMSLIDVFDNMSRFYPSIESKDDSNYPFCGKRY